MRCTQTTACLIGKPECQHYKEGMRGRGGRRQGRGVPEYTGEKTNGRRMTGREWRGGRSVLREHLAWRGEACMTGRRVWESLSLNTSW